MADVCLSCLVAPLRCWLLVFPLFLLHVQAKGPVHVFYNRVPKAASTAMRSIISDLQHDNQFQFVSSKVYDDRALWSPAVERANAIRISSIFNASSSNRVVYDQHVRYINFTQHGLAQPLYINMVREPAARIVSTYYYARTGTHARRAEIRARLGQQADWSIDECVSRGKECKFTRALRSNLMTKFFCGHHAQCSTINETAYARAAYNLEHNYVLVGITERFSDTLRLLEAAVPDVFAGAVRVLASKGIRRSNKNDRAGPPPSDATRAVIREAARYDVMLYEHALALFNRRLQELERRAR